MITVIFQYVVADVSLFPKSSSSAETVKFWPRTGSHCGTPAGRAMWGLRRTIYACVSRNRWLSMQNHISATLWPNSIILFSEETSSTGEHVAISRITGGKVFILFDAILQYYSKTNPSRDFPPTSYERRVVMETIVTCFHSNFSCWIRCNQAFLAEKHLQCASKQILSFDPQK